ncbi:MAG: hypothetical protein EBZ69_10490 [Alphaproteobacteria bacterium]|nr:hypothetical protein [Alphaproteobacteria bacterium]NDG05570.1 hypothetical protein [Alphaproteobacteria bacterium]
MPDAAAVDMVPAAFLEHGTRQQWAHTMAQLCTEHSRPCDHPAFKTVVLPQTPLGFFVGHPLFWRAGTKHLPYFVPKAA